MSRLSIETPGRAQNVLDGLHRDMERRIGASAYGLCPVDMSLNYLRLCHAQTCGKCVPCRIGLGQLEVLIEQVLDRTATMETINIIERTAKVIADSAGCAIGYEAAYMVLKGIRGFREDYEEHVQHGRCISALSYPVPCVSACPAHVDVPGYVALVNEGKYEEAVRLIRKDNPFPSACAYVCVHSCEAHCRRAMVDDAINICGLKRFAVDNAKAEPAKILYEKTGKTVGIIGGGPGGLTAAYYLAQMGHKVTVYEQRPKLGGMLRYGIPDYRLPQEVLERDIEHILTTGINVITDVSIGRDVTMEDIQKSYDAVYISIGAHNDKKLGIEGEDAENVVSAVSLLRRIHEGNAPDFTGKRICVIGGGNVSMDATRTAKRLGATEVSIVYRRRKDDMTALPDEIGGAIAEGCALVQLKAPSRIAINKRGEVQALWVKPQIAGQADKSGRPRPVDSSEPEEKIPCDIIISAIGQATDIHFFEEFGIPVFRGNIQAKKNSVVDNVLGTYAGGDCVTGPSTVINAVAAGKVAAANIDAYLGFNHEITVDVDIPVPTPDDHLPCGRVELKERFAKQRGNDFDEVEQGMSLEEAMQEASRCLRCDYHGFGSFRGGRDTKW